LEKGLRVQESSGEVLDMVIHDMLDLSQIRSGNFRKNIIEYDIVRAVDEIMMIQQRKADDNSIQLQARFMNIRESSDDDYMSNMRFEFD
jgi:signal transduction histidine kinase